MRDVIPLKDQLCLYDRVSNCCMECKCLSVVVEGDLVHLECMATGDYLRDYKKNEDGYYEEYKNI